MEFKCCNFTVAWHIGHKINHIFPLWKNIPFFKGQAHSCMAQNSVHCAVFPRSVV